MKRAALLTLTLLLGAGCVGRDTTPSGESASVNTALKPSVVSAAATPASVVRAGTLQRERKEEVPGEFSEANFRNFTYPLSLEGKKVRLSEGEFEYAYRDNSGGGWVSFKDVSFADLNGDGKKEAVVQLSLVSCGASCDGGSDLFYFYTIRDGRLALLSEFGTGNLAYECGLKSFVLEKGKLIVEGFRECRYSRGFLNAPVSAKFYADRFTRFEFKFNGKRLSLKKREVFAFPEGNTMNNRAVVRIGDE